MNRRMFCGGLLGLPAAVLAGKPTVAAAPVTYAPTFTIDSRADAAEIARAIRQSDERTIQRIADMARRGGSYKRAFRT